jgi:crossover junction endodeoxyribonuclease RusA
MIELPFPPATLSGHNTGHWRAKSGIVAKHREWARNAVMAVVPGISASTLTAADIRVSVTFYPPDRRGDRTNYPNRMKPYFDGIADALCVNDRRFLPSYHFAEPCKPGKVVVVIGQ